jgi:hypothetical protein
MNINEEVANGIVISGEDFEYATAIRKPNINTKIIREFWFKGTNKKLMEVLKKK